MHLFLTCVTLAGAYNCRFGRLSSFIAPPGPKSTHYFHPAQIPTIPKNSETREFKEPESSLSTWVSRCIEAAVGIKVWNGALASAQKVRRGDWLFSLPGLWAEPEAIKLWWFLYSWGCLVKLSQTWTLPNGCTQIIWKIPMTLLAF